MAQVFSPIKKIRKYFKDRDGLFGLILSGTFLVLLFGLVTLIFANYVKSGTIFEQITPLGSVLFVIPIVLFFLYYEDKIEFMPHKEIGEIKLSVIMISLFSFLYYFMLVFQFKNYFTSFECLMFQATGLFFLVGLCFYTCSKKYIQSREVLHIKQMEEIAKRKLNPFGTETK
ncbi:MAG: hypothetical protein LBG67_02305 [Campylobacteraceae bacterium]|nr:hypothetical protein [Campylobacteraceae bacterium]